MEDVNAAVDAGGVNVLYGTTNGLATTGNQFWTQDSNGIKDVAEQVTSSGRAWPPATSTATGSRTWLWEPRSTRLAR